MMTIYIAVCSDRHSDIEVKPFVNFTDAIAYCKKFAGEKLSINPLTKPMQQAGWIFYGNFSPEGNDYVIVMERELDDVTVVRNA